MMTMNREKISKIILTRIEEHCSFDAFLFVKEHFKFLEKATDKEIRLNSLFAFFLGVILTFLACVFYFRVLI
jgi:hypothetical protein